ncbi:MAG: hypothetical protein WCV58_01420 [Patescibacteria group bacterium]
METQILAVVSQFVDLALKYDWKEIKELPDHEMQILFELVSVTGFGLDVCEVKQLVLGKSNVMLPSHYGDSLQFRRVNKLCPFKITDLSNKDHEFATGWLDCALQCAIDNAKDREQLIETIAAEVKQSFPLEPIQLTQKGDLLEERFAFSQGRYFYFVRHGEESDKIYDDYHIAGHHVGCNGPMHHTLHQDENSIWCVGCDLDIAIPKEIETYGELRQFMSLELSQVTT